MSQHLPLHPTKRHPHTGAPLRAIFVRRDGRVFWPILGASPDDPADPPKTDPPADPPADDGPKKGEVGYFPPNTAKADMTAAEALAYDAFHGRKHEDRNKAWQKALNGKTAEQVSEDLKELERLRTASLSESEKAVNDAKIAGRREASLAAAPQLFDVALSHVNEDRRKVLIENTDLSRVINEDGTIDTDKVKTIAAALAPAATDDGEKRRRDFAAGDRRTSTTSGVAAGREAFRERRGKKSTTTNDS